VGGLLRAIIARAMLHNPGREAREAQSLTGEVNHGNEEDKFEDK